MEMVKTKEKQLKEMAKGLAKLNSRDKMGEEETESFRSLVKDMAHIDDLNTNIANLKE